jgi:hypothetical protein
MGKPNNKSKKNKPNQMEEPVAVYSSRLRDIGNSKGLILNSKAIKIAGLDAGADILVQAGKGIITIIQENQGNLNTNLSTWDKQFKSMIRSGAGPEPDIFNGMKNDFDENEW